MIIKRGRSIVDVGLCKMCGNTHRMLANKEAPPEHPTATEITGDKRGREGRRREESIFFFFLLLFRETV